MPTPPLNRLQRLVTKHFAGGEYSNHECHIPGDTGDLLFDFIMSEAGDDCIAQAEEQGLDAVALLLQRLATASLGLALLQVQLIKELDQ